MIESLFWAGCDLVVPAPGRQNHTADFMPHFQLRDYLYSALQKDLACRDAGWLGLWSDWEDHNQSPCGASPLPMFIPCGHISGLKSVVFYCVLLTFWAQPPVGLRFLWWPPPGGPKVFVRVIPRWAFDLVAVGRGRPSILELLSAQF